MTDVVLWMNGLCLGYWLCLFSRNDLTDWKIGRRSNGTEAKWSQWMKQGGQKNKKDHNQVFYVFTITAKVNWSTGTHLVCIVGQRLWHSGRAHASFQGGRGFQYRRELSGSSGRLISIFWWENNLKFIKIKKWMSSYSDSGETGWIGIDGVKQNLIFAVRSVTCIIISKQTQWQKFFYHIEVPKLEEGQDFCL